MEGIKGRIDLKGEHIVVHKRESRRRKRGSWGEGRFYLRQVSPGVGSCHLSRNKGVKKGIKGDQTKEITL